MGFSLIADRFVPLAHALHLDVATGDHAWLRIEPATEDADGLRWAERCATLITLWHPSLAECLDFGLLPTGQRFEAYRVNQLLPRRAGRVFDASRVRDRVDEFLFACGVLPGAPSIEGADASGRWLAVPGAYDGVVAASPATDANLEAASTPVDATGTSRAHPRLPDGSVGVRLVHRAIYDAVRERLSVEPPTGISVTDVEAVPGAGGRTLLRYCAREARRLGWVALATPALRWIEAGRARHGSALWDDIIGGRHVIVLHDGRRSSLAADHELTAILLRLGTRVPRPHRLFQLVLRPRAADALCLTPLMPAERDRMFVLGADARSEAQHVRSAAAAGGGLPGGCIAAVLRLCAPPSRIAEAVVRAHVVHEPRSEFGGGPPAAPAPLAILNTASGPGRPDVWRAIAESGRLAAAGRHAAAERLLRRAGHAQLRRGRDCDAADAALASGRLHADRGRTRMAIASFSEALSRYEAAGATTQMIAASAWLGRAFLDVLQIDESEACLRSAVAAGALADRLQAHEWARISLARTLWWLGRSDEAHVLLLGSETTECGWRDCRVAPAPRVLALARAALSVRVSCALGELERAGAYVTAAREHAAASATPASACLAELARAHWSAALRDLAGVDESVARGLLFARDARRPFDALRFRIVRCQAHACAGSRKQAASDRRPLERALARGLPELLAARARLALAACAGPAEMEMASARCHARGLVALVQSCSPAKTGVGARTAMIDDVIEVLRICQEGEDARAALVEVARLVQARTRADAVVFVAAARRPLLVAWPSAGRLHVHAASRALETGAALAPGARRRRH